MEDNTKIKIRLIEIEKKFEILRAKVEKFHKFFLIIYFLPPLSALFLLSRYFKEYYSFYAKVVLFAVILSGLFIHFYLRHKYHKSRNKYKNFIESEFSEIKNEFASDEDFRKAVISAVGELFNERNIEFSGSAINDSFFWNMIFVYLEIKIE